MPGCGAGVVQPAQRDEAGQELGIEQLLGRDLAVVRGQRVGAGSVAVAQQAAGEQVALGPERGELVGHRRVSLRRLARRAATAPARPRCGRRGAASARGRAPGRDRHARRPAGRRAATRRWAHRAAARAVPRLAARCAASRRATCRAAAVGVVPGQALEPRPLVLRPDGCRPAAQEGGLGGRVGDAGESRRGGPRLPPRALLPGVGLSLGAAQHRLRQGQAVALALRQDGRAWSGSAAIASCRRRSSSA